MESRDKSAMGEGTTNFPVSTSLLGRLYEVAEKHADQIAVTNADGTAVSYRQLFMRASRLAKELEAAGIGVGDMVTLLDTCK